MSDSELAWAELCTKVESGVCLCVLRDSSRSLSLPASLLRDLSAERSWHGCCWARCAPRMVLAAGTAAGRSVPGCAESPVAGSSWCCSLPLG